MSSAVTGTPSAQVMTLRIFQVTSMVLVVSLTTTSPFATVGSSAARTGKIFPSGSIPVMPSRVMCITKASYPVSLMTALKLGGSSGMTIVMMEGPEGVAVVAVVAVAAMVGVSGVTALTLVVPVVLVGWAGVAAGPQLIRLTRSRAERTAQTILVHAFFSFICCLLVGIVLRSNPSSGAFPQASTARAG